MTSSGPSTSGGACFILGLASLVSVSLLAVLLPCWFTLPSKISNTLVALTESTFVKQHLLIKYLWMDYLLSLEVIQLLAK